jgi:hypothetical protein
MEQKYRLKIPEMIRKRNASTAKKLEQFDGEIFPYNINSLTNDFSEVVDVMEIPSDWLEPIEPGPVSVKEWLISKFPEPLQQDYEESMVEAFKAGEANHAKRVKPVIDAIKGHIKKMDVCLPKIKWSETMLPVVKALKTMEENERPNH